MHLVDTTMFFAPESGGVKRYLLAKRDWIARNTQLRHTLLVPGARRGEEAGGLYRVPAPPLPFTGGYRFPLGTGAWVDALRGLRPDVIEAGDPYVTPWAVLEASDRLGVPAVAFHHSDLTRLLSSRLGSWSAPHIDRYLARLYRCFDLVLAPSRVMVRKLEAIGVDRVGLQPLGVDTGLFHPDRADPALRRELDLDPQTRLLVFAGRFSKEKHIPQLIGAFRRLGSGYHLLLIGGAQRARPLPNVTQLPYQGSGETLARYLASADALVHAGDSETFGLIVAEAMACGRPAVGVNAGAVPELLDESVGQLVHRPGERDLAEGIEALCRRDLALLGARARRRVEQRYSWDQVLRTLIWRYGRLTGAGDLLPSEKQRALA